MMNAMATEALASNSKAKQPNHAKTLGGKMSSTLDKEYIGLYVSKDKAEEYRQLKSIQGDDKMLDQYLEQYREDFKFDMETLDNDLIEYKAKIIKWNKALTEARNETIAKSEELWNQFQEQLPNFSRQVDSLVSQFKPLEDAINGINKTLGKINEWRIDRFIDLINKVANMSDKEKEIMLFFMAHSEEIGQ